MTGRDRIEPKDSPPTDRAADAHAAASQEVGQRVAPLWDFDGTGAGEGTDTLTYTYDALGNPNQEKRGSTVLTDDGYDLGTGRLTSRADGSAGTTTFGYDWAGRQTNVTSPLATSSTTLTYNLDGSKASRSLGNASQTYTYDAVGRQLTATVAGGAASTLQQAYDRVGNVVEYDYDLGSTPGVSSGQSQYFSYDGLNRLVQENLGSSSLTCGSAGSTCYTYDRDGNRLSQNAAGTTTTWTYDRSDQIITTAQSGTNASFGYDAAGNLLTQQLFGTASADTSAPSTPTGASATATAYNQVSLTWTASTDNLGVARYLIARGGSQISEVAGSATSFTDTSVAPSTAYIYTVTAVDAAGNTSAPSSAAAVTTPAYTTQTTFGPTADAYVSSSHGQTNKNYGSDTSLYVDGSHTSYLMFDTSSLPSGTITGATLQAWADASDSAGFSTASSSDTSWTETGITSNNAPAFGSSLGSSGAVSAGAYASADASGGVTGRGPLTLVMTNPSASGTYESRENSHPPQLVVTTAATPPADTSAPSVPTGLGATANGSSEIDLAWTTSTDNVAVQGYRVYRDSTLIATTASTSYADTGLASSTIHSYTVAAIDGTGNASAQSASANATTTGPSAVTTTSTYDLGDRTTSVAGAATATFTFDALGRPASRTIGSTTDGYAYVGSSTAAWQVATGGGATISAILDTTNARLGLASGSTQTWLVDDAHGSPVAGYSASGSAITDALRYTGYGTTLGSYASGSGIVSVWGYQGDLNLSPDAGTSLYANGARLYAPSLGTFTQLDTYLGDPSNPLSLNRYLYGGGNPTSTNDPSGHMLMAGATTDAVGGAPPATTQVTQQNPELVYSNPSFGYSTPSVVSSTTTSPTGPSTQSPAPAQISFAPPLGTIASGAQLQAMSIGELKAYLVAREKSCGGIASWSGTCADYVAAFCIYANALGGGSADCGGYVSPRSWTDLDGPLFDFVVAPTIALGAGWLSGALVTEVEEHPELLSEVPQITQNAVKGRQFQTAVLQFLRTPENFMQFGSEPGVNVRPDSLLNGITEIKNVQAIYRTDQLEGMFNLAMNSKLPFNLIVSPNTTSISQTVQRFVANTGGTIEVFNPASQQLYTWMP